MRNEVGEEKVVELVVGVVFWQDPLSINISRHGSR